MVVANVACVHTVTETAIYSHDAVVKTRQHDSLTELLRAGSLKLGSNSCGMSDILGVLESPHDHLTQALLSFSEPERGMARSHGRATPKKMKR